MELIFLLQVDQYKVFFDKKMKFKINSYKNSPIGYEVPHEMNKVIHDRTVQVDASDHCMSTHIDKDTHLICIGQIIGRILKNGELTLIESWNNFISEAITQYSLKEVANQIEGRFMLVLVKSDRKVAICADRYSKLEIFIQETEQGVTLSSDISLLQEDPSARGFDQNALVHMLTYYGYCPPKKHTIYNSVKRLGVGEVAELFNGVINIKEDMFNGANSYNLNESDHKIYKNKFLNHLKIAGSDSGNVVYLSSGWDSTSILAGLVHIFGANKVRAVTGKMCYSDRSGVCNQPEIDRAKKIAEYYGIELTIVEFEYINNGVNYLEQIKGLMKNNQIYSLTAHTHGKLAEKVRSTSNNLDEAVFAGEISDGAHNLGFSQYATIFHPSFGFREYSDKIASYLFGPTFLSLIKTGEYINDPVYKMLINEKTGIKFDQVMEEESEQVLQLITSFFLRNGRVPFWSHENIKLLTNKGIKKYTEEMQKTYLNKASSSITEKNIYSWYLHLYNSFHWQGGTVRSLSLLADHYDINSDLPFWDTGIQEFLSTMPEDWGRGLDLNPTKFPLKYMLKNSIDYPYEIQKGPHAYTYDTNHSFNHMEEVFLHSKFRVVIQDALSDRPYKQILDKDYFNLEYIDSIVDKYLDNSIILQELSDLVPIAMMSYVGWFGKE